MLISYSVKCAWRIYTGNMTYATRVMKTSSIQSEDKKYMGWLNNITNDSTHPVLSTHSCSLREQVDKVAQGNQRHIPE